MTWYILQIKGAQVVTLPESGTFGGQSITIDATSDGWELCSEVRGYSVTIQQILTDYVIVTVVVTAVVGGLRSQDVGQGLKLVAKCSDILPPE